MHRLFTDALANRNMQHLDKIPGLLLNEQEKEWRKWIYQYRTYYDDYPSPERLQIEFPDFEPTYTTVTRGLLETVIEDRKRILVNTFVIECHSMGTEELRQATAELAIKIAAMPTIVMRLTEPDYALFSKPKQGSFIFTNAYSNLIKGVYPGELITLVGASGVGKSILAMNTAINWFLTGHKVVLIAADMHPHLTMARAHAMVLRKNTELLHEVSPLAFKALTHLMDSQQGELIIPERSPSTVSEIGALMTEYKADNLIVDGTYFLKASWGKRGFSRGWENISQVSEELRDLAHYRAARVVSISQTNTDGDVAFSNALAQDSDIVTKVTQVATLESTEAKMLKVETIKNRRGNQFYATIQLNYNTMSIVDKKSGVLSGVMK